LGELWHIQDQLLARAAGYVRGGGRLVYATCSVLPSENEDRIAGFLARASDFAIVPAHSAWKSLGGVEMPGLGMYFRASPLRTGTDGFFAAILERKF
ncbi:MAG: hypothetical protein JOZ55_07945, partial [Alphaproteobacteria bacterium]|nr:hypothetical protein [Alphaproteobacteria bacterium]